MGLRPQKLVGLPGALGARMPEAGKGVGGDHGNAHGERSPGPSLRARGAMAAEGAVLLCWTSPCCYPAGTATGMLDQVGEAAASSWGSLKSVWQERGRRASKRPHAGPVLSQEGAGVLEQQPARCQPGGVWKGRHLQLPKHPCANQFCISLALKPCPCSTGKRTERSSDPGLTSREGVCLLARSTSNVMKAFLVHFSVFNI